MNNDEERATRKKIEAEALQKASDLMNDLSDAVAIKTSALGDMLTKHKNAFGKPFAVINAGSGDVWGASPIQWDLSRMWVLRNVESSKVTSPYIDWSHSVHSSHCPFDEPCVLNKYTINNKGSLVECNEKKQCSPVKAVLRKSPYSGDLNEKNRSLSVINDALDDFMTFVKGEGLQNLTSCVTSIPSNAEKWDKL